MNLTDYDDCAQSENDMVLRRSQVLAARNNLGEYEYQPMGGFFKSLVKTIKRTSEMPLTSLKALKDDGIKGVIKSGTDELKNIRSQDLRQVVAPVLSAVSLVFPVLAPIAAGAKAAGNYVKVQEAQKSADFAQKQAYSDALKSASGDHATLIKGYQDIAGKIAGRQIGTGTMKQIGLAAIANGIWPSPLGMWAGMEEDIWEARAGRSVSNPKNKSGLGMREWAEHEIAAGNLDPAKAAATYLQAGGFPQPASPLHAQLYIDAFDALIAEKASDAPYTYGINIPDEVVPAPANTGIVPTPPAPTSAPAKVAEVEKPAALAATGIDPATQTAIANLIAAMNAKGANDAQMQAQIAALLASRGVDAKSAPIQQAIAADVTAAKSDKTPLLVAVGLAGAALLYGMTRGGRK